MTGNWNVLAFLSKVLVVSTCCSNLERERERERERVYIEKYALHLPHIGPSTVIATPPTPPAASRRFFGLFVFMTRAKC